MIKTFMTGAALAVLASSSVLAAATPAGVTVSQDRLETSVRKSPFVYRPTTPPPKGLTTIYSNLGGYFPKAIYYPFDGNTISGANSLIGFASTGVQFTPSANMTVKEVDTAVGTILGTNELDVSIYSDNGGVPGTAIGTAVAKKMHTFGDCCDLTVVKMNVKVTAGTVYWLVLEADPKAQDAWGAWPQNATDEIDGIVTAGNVGNGWINQGASVPNPAFAIYGK